MIYLGNCHCIDNGLIEVVEADTSPHTSIEELWAMMPEDNKQYYKNSIEVYRHHKLAQTLKTGE